MADKKAASKKTATKKTVAKEASTRGNAYELTAAGKTQLADISGQGAIIRDCIKGSKAPLTAAAITERVGKQLKTTNAARTISFYLCTWKADGFVRFSK